MPEYTRGQARNQLTFVPLNARLHYGWKTVDLAARTGVSAADIKTQLGHLTPTEASAIANRIMITGANSPKPARVVKRDLTAPISQPASTSTFIAFNKLATANAAGWSLASDARGVRLVANVDGKRSITAIAELTNGLLYAFSLNRVDFDRVSTALGLQSAGQITATERQILVSGSRSKPGQAATEDSGGVFATFFSTASEDTAIAAGYNIIKREKVEYPAGTGGTP